MHAPSQSHKYKLDYLKTWTSFFEDGVLSIPFWLISSFWKTHGGFFGCSKHVFYVWRWLPIERSMEISGLIHCTYMYRGLNTYMYIHVCTCVYIHVSMHEYNMFTCTCIYIWVHVRKKTRTWEHSQRTERWGEEECSVFVLIPNLVSRYRWRSGDNIVCCSVLQHTATHCNTPQHGGVLCTCINTRSWAAVLLEEQEMATHLPHTHCNAHTLHHTAMHCTML